MGQKIKKRDIILALSVIAVSLILLLLLRNGEKGRYINIYVDGKIEGTYFLTEREQTVKAGDKNIITIINGEAYMKSAECPDKICIQKGKISHCGEDIICMPNRVIVRVEGGGFGE